MDEFITLDQDKDVYYKKLSDDKIINITGESGSGKSYYCNNNYNSDEYIILDTDLIFGNLDKSDGYNREFGLYLKNKYNKIIDICYEFDLFYKEVLDYFNKVDKYIVIDSAQFRNIKDINLLKGEFIVIRTCINKCYDNCINRWIKNKSEYTEDELNQYKERKKGMFIWYKSINEFISKIDML